MKPGRRNPLLEPPEEAWLTIGLLACSTTKELVSVALSCPMHGHPKSQETTMPSYSSESSSIEGFNSFLLEVSGGLTLFLVKNPK